MASEEFECGPIRKKVESGNSDCASAVFEEKLFAAGSVSVKAAPYRSGARKSMASQEFQCVHLYEKSAESRNSDCVSAVFEEELFAAGPVSAKVRHYSVFDTWL